MLDEIVPDKSLIRAMWVRGLKGDPAILRMLAEYKWGKVPETPDPPVEEPVRDDVVYRCTLPEGPPATTWRTPADDPDEEDPDTKT